MCCLRCTQHRPSALAVGSTTASLRECFSFKLDVCQVVLTCSCSFQPTSAHGLRGLSVLSMPEAARRRPLDYLSPVLVSTFDSLLELELQHLCGVSLGNSCPLGGSCRDIQRFWWCGGQVNELSARQMLLCFSSLASRLCTSGFVSLESCPACVLAAPLSNMKASTTG